MFFFFFLLYRFFWTCPLLLSYSLSLCLVLQKLL